jgi:hypothetical protein
MPDHDSLYHRLFDHPGIVAELLREFVDCPWLDDLDLDGMTRENAKFHAGTGDRRDGDMVWRIPRRSGGETYLLLLLEFQSTQDRWMALRVLVYAGLLWQHLVNEKRLPPDGRLPPILPVVLYNGDGPWTAPLALHALVGLPGDSRLWQWQPEMRYQIVDEGAFAEADLAARDALLALLFRLESSPDPRQVVAVTDALLVWLKTHPGFDRLRPVLAEMLGGILAPNGSAMRVPEDLQEIRNMLATRMKAWEENQLKRLEEKLKRQWQGEAEEKARQEGRQAGEAAILLRQLERRFGALPAWVRDRVATADTTALEEWGLRILDGGGLEDVLT